VAGESAAVKISEAVSSLVEPTNLMFIAAMLIFGFAIWWYVTTQLGG
jgi:hypothetical protein